MQAGVTWNSITQVPLFEINKSLPSHHVNLRIPNWNVFTIVLYLSNFPKLKKNIFWSISIFLSDFYWKRYHFHNLSDLTDAVDIIICVCVNMYIHIYILLCISYV